MRYLRQQVLHARDHGSPLSAQFVVRMPAPDLPGSYIDAFLRASDLYVFGIGNRHAEFYFKDYRGAKLIGNQQVLGFTGHYNDLGSYAALSVDRSAINTAISQLSYWRRAGDIANKQKDRCGAQQLTPAARHLMIAILVTAEAVRFFKIEETVANALDGRPNAPLDPLRVEDLTHNWAKLSKANDFRQVAIMAPDNPGV